MSAKVEKFVECRIQLKQFKKVAEFDVWGDVHLCCVCQMTKEIAADPDSLIFVHRILKVVRCLCVTWTNTFA